MTMKKHLLKTLLVATGLLAGTLSSWADVETTTTKFDFEDENAVFTGDSRITVAIENDENLGSNVVAFTNAKNAQNGYSFAHYDFSNLIPKAQKITVSFDYWNTNGGRNYMTIGDAAVRGTTGNSSKTTYNKKGAIFRIGSDKSNFYINDTKVTLANFANKWLNVSVTINPETQKVSYSIKEVNGNELKAENDISYYDASATSCSQIDAFGYINNSKMAKIDNLTISVDKDKSATFANYTIAFKDEDGNSLKTDETGNGKVGAIATLTESVKASFFNEDKSIKFIYKSDHTESNPINADGKTTITITFRHANKWNYVVNSIVDNITNKIGGNEDFEEENIATPYPQYILKNGILYEAKRNSSATYYLKEFTLDQNNKNVNITYSPSSIKNVVYFSEAEDINGLTSTSGSLATVRCSNGVGAYNGNDEAVKVCTLPAGVYKLTANVWGNTGENILINYGTEENWAIPTKGYLWTESKTITLNNSTDITIPKCGNSGKMLDYLYIQEISETASITDAQYATYVTKSAVIVPENVKVFTVKKANAKGIETTELEAGTTIPANTAVLLNAEAGDYAFAVSTEAGTELDNNLKPSPSDGITATGVEYCLTQQDGKIGFAKVHKGIKIPAGKAYLEVPEQSASANFFALDDTVTAIKNIETEKTEDNAYYTLQGVKVVNPTKGIYIHNGKKVVIQ